MAAYDFYTGSLGSFSTIDYIISRNYVASVIETARYTLSAQQYYKMRAYVSVSGSYITWVSTGSIDTNGTNSGYPTSSLSDVTVLPQYS